MARVAFVHWKSEEAGERLARLRKAGFRPAAMPDDGAEAYKVIRERPPDAVVIDLSRLPSHGREMAMALRTSKATRRVRIIFVAGDEEKIARIRSHLPDATYTTWRGIRGAVKRALENSPDDPVVPSSRLAGYSGTPLVRKLGLKPGGALGLISAPRGFESTLGDLPRGARLVCNPRNDVDLLLWFVESKRDLDARITSIAKQTGSGGLWIAWPEEGLRCGDRRHAA